MKILKFIVVYIITLQARAVLWKYKPKLIAVTGSVGKTATKEAISSVMDGVFYARSSIKSYNSEIGVPLTILGCENPWNSFSGWLSVFVEGLALIFLKNHYPSWLVIEVGTDGPGDIKRMTKWLAPDIVVVTHFGEVPVHIEFFSSREELINEKMNLVYAVKDGGVLLLNADDSDVRAIQTKTNEKVITFGIKESATMKAVHIEILYDKENKPSGVIAKVEYNGKVFPIKIKGTIGEHFMLSLLAALGVGVSLEMNILRMLDSLKSFDIPPGRLKILSGINDTTIIDDSYNSSPTAAESALTSFKKIKTQGRKVLILGDMLELGKYTSNEHKKIGAFARHVGDYLFTVGPRSKIMNESALEQGMNVRNTKHFEDAESAGLYIKDFLETGDIVLVKGSQGIRLEKIVEMILLKSEDAPRLLVRQDKAWKRR